ncbi:MAG: hypothetical protein U0176_04330 [Bacteroidia bacterium]
MKQWLLGMFACAFLAVAQPLPAQWTNLGTQSLPLVMTGDYHGIRAAHVQGSTPGSGTTWRFFGTNDDWVTLDWRATGGGNEPGCCVVEHLLFRDEDRGFNVTRTATGLQVNRTEDKGFTWEAMGEVSGISIDSAADLCSTRDTVAYVIGNEDGFVNHAAVLRYTPATRRVIFSSTAHDGAEGRVMFLNDSLGFISALHTSGIYQLLRTTNGGLSWSTRLQVAIGTLHAIQFVTPQIGFVAGESGVLYKTTDAGFTWNSLAANGPVDIYDIDFLDEQTGYLACGAGLVLRTIDGGNIWFSDEIDSSQTFTYVKAISADIAYVLGRDSVLYKRNYVVGQEDAESESVQLTLFPNPATDRVAIGLGSGDRLRSWRMLDMQGRIVMTGNELELHVAQLPAALYSLQVVTAKGVVTRLLRVD